MLHKSVLSPTTTNSNSITAVTAETKVQKLQKLGEKLKII